MVFSSKKLCAKTVTLGLIFVGLVSSGILSSDQLRAQENQARAHTHSHRPAPAKKEGLFGGTIAKQFKAFKNSITGPLPSEETQAPEEVTKPRTFQNPLSKAPSVEPFAQRRVPIVPGPRLRSMESAIEPPVSENNTSPTPIEVPASIRNAYGGTSTLPTVVPNTPTKSLMENAPAIQADDTTYVTPQESLSSKSSSRRNVATKTPSSEATAAPLVIENGFSNSGSAPATSNQTEIEFDVTPKVSRKTGNTESPAATAPTATADPSVSSSVIRQSKSADDIPTGQVALSSKDSSSGKKSGLRIGMPQVRLECLGPSAVQINEATTYHVRATNEGPENLQGLLVRVVFPTDINLIQAKSLDGQTENEENTKEKSIVWQIDGLAAGQSKQLNLDIEALKAEEFKLDFEWTVLPITGQMPIQVQQPQLSVVLEGASETLYGRPEMYKLRVRNPGTAAAKEVKVAVTAESFGRSEAIVGDVPAGEERTMEVELTFLQTGNVHITIDGQSELSKLTASNVLDVNVRKADIVAKWDVPPEQFPDMASDYHLSVTNNGTISCDQLKCIAMLPNGAQVVQLPKGMTQDGNKVSWIIPRLGPQEKVNYAIKMKLTEEGENTVKFQTMGSAGGMAECVASIRVESIADLKLSVIDPVAPAPVGKPVEYVLVIENRGTKPANSVRVVAQFSSGVEPIETKGHESQVVPGQVIFSPIPTIAPGKEVRLSVFAKAGETGTHRFRVEVTSDESDTQLIQEESTRYLATGSREDGTVR
jgi:Domain of unknown function DUF11